MRSSRSFLANRHKGALSRRTGHRPLVYAHRGDAQAAPENTIAAFEAAADAGADGIELDVRLCQTGEVVVFHDPTLERMTDKRDTRAVADLPLDELTELDLGAGHRVPLLKDILAWGRRRELLINVEMKRDVPNRAALVAATARLLETWDPAHPVLVSSFDPAMLVSLAAVAPSVPRAQLVHPCWYARALASMAVPVGAVALHPNRTLTRPDRLAEWCKRYVVNVWTVNDPSEMVDLAALGVDGIITDEPALACQTYS